MPRQKLSEALNVASATPVAGQTGRFLIELITPGWGSSAYYSPEVLKEAADAKIFPAGLHMYLDHEMADGSGVDDHGNRSVKDLAAVYESDAEWNGKSLVTVATVFGPYREVLDQMKESIGLSINAYADVTIGEAEGKRGPIVNRLVEALSTDFVTHAGRGGKILQVIESARAGARAEFARDRESSLVALRESRNIGQWIESRLHLELTRIGDDMYGNGYLTREERIALSGAVGDALDAFTESLTTSAPQLFERDLWDDPGLIAAQVEEATKNVPVTRPGSNTIPTEESEEDTMPEIKIEESEHRRLLESDGRVKTLESERDAAVQRAEKAEGERDELRESKAAGERSTKAAQIIESKSAGKVEFSALEITGLTANLPVTESGELDEAKFGEAIDTEIAKALEAAGIGGVRGFGGGAQTQSTQTGATSVVESIDKARADAFGRKVKEA